MRVVAIALVVAALGVAGAASCTLFQESIPDRSCMDDGDCFRAQGERCNLGTHLCGPPVDAAPIYDAPPVPDAVDAVMVDAVDAVMADAPVDAP